LFFKLGIAKNQGDQLALLLFLGHFKAQFSCKLLQAVKHFIQRIDIIVKVLESEMDFLVSEKLSWSLELPLAF